jgi:UDP-N-acetylglucosamine acyltransferase
MPPVSARIHPTAIISSEAEIASDAVVGPYAVIEGQVRLGPGCVVRPYVHLVGPLTMGAGNTVYTGAVLGERPQHLKYADEPTRLEIGDHNVFREHVTVHRGTLAGPHLDQGNPGGVTRIGSRNYFMAHSHIAHDCQVGNQCIFANGALLAGHVVIDDGVFLSGNCAVHQFVRIGRLALLSGCAITTKDMPPFAVLQGITCIVGVNVVGMRRAGMSHDTIDAVRRAYYILFHEGRVLSAAMDQVEQDLGANPAVAEVLAFIRGSKRGVSGARERRREAA